MKQQNYGLEFDEKQEGSKQKIITLNEPITTTITRDLSTIVLKLKYAMLPSLRQTAKKQLRNWDLWGPLVLCLLLSLTLSIRAGSSTQAIVTSIFVILSIGSVVVWLNAHFLGANMSFFQSASLLGYCLFPVNIVSLISCIFGDYLPIIIKLILVIISFAWSTLCSINFVGEMVPQRKKKLALYPIGLFYLFLSWFVLIV